MKTTLSIVLVLLLASSLFGADINSECVAPNAQPSMHSENPGSSICTRFIQNPDCELGTSVVCQFSTYAPSAAFSYSAFGISGLTLETFKDQFISAPYSVKIGYIFKYFDNSITGQTMNLPSGNGMDANGYQDYHGGWAFLMNWKINRGFVLYTQVNAPWSELPYADGVYKMKNLSCYLCCVAMECAQQGFDMTPGQWNEELKAQRNPRGYIGRSVNPAGVLAVCKKYGYKFKFIRNMPCATALQRNLPVQMRVKNDRHSVLVIAHRNSSDWLIYDPMDRGDNSNVYSGVNSSNTRVFYRVREDGNGYLPSPQDSLQSVPNNTASQPSIDNSSVQVFSNNYSNCSLNLAVKGHDYGNYVYFKNVDSSQTEYTETPEGISVPMGTSVLYQSAPTDDYQIAIVGSDATYDLTLAETDSYGAYKETRLTGKLVSGKAIISFKHIASPVAKPTISVISIDGISTNGLSSFTINPLGSMNVSGTSTGNVVSAKWQSPNASGVIYPGGNYWYCSLRSAVTPYYQPFVFTVFDANGNFASQTYNIRLNSTNPNVVF